ncbi:hypothetical protein GYMLUDRAFT_241108 [Collybiopsis luxurians FD-317 M1]|nr:hypothetical protein GYMLUDRAFT_241108 [Collybiopsis luxurians FD-317 M1]
MKWDEVYDLVQWRWDPQEAEFLEQYLHFDDAQIRYPHLQVCPFHPLTNFLLPHSVRTHTLIPVSLHLIPILNLATDSLRSLPFTDQSTLSMFHNPLLMLTLSALVFQEPTNYQPLETLGDVGLKVVMAAQLLGVSIWPEGCLMKGKGHTRLAKESVTSMLYMWLLEFGHLQNKWEPLYIATIASVPTEELSKLSCVTDESRYYAKSARG